MTNILCFVHVTHFCILCKILYTFYNLGLITRAVKFYYEGRRVFKRLVEFFSDGLFRYGHCHTETYLCLFKITLIFVAVSRDVKTIYAIIKHSVLRSVCEVNYTTDKYANDTNHESE